MNEREMFIATLTRELPDVAPHHVVALARKLMRYSASHHRLAEMECNGPWQVNSPTLPNDVILKALERHEAYVERETERYERLIVKACEGYPLKPEFQGDPRGATVKLHVPSGRDESWGGVAVPNGSR